MKVKSESEVAQSVPTLPDPMNCSLPGSSIHGIFQARVLEWGAIAFSPLCMYLKIIKNICAQKTFTQSMVLFEIDCYKLSNSRMLLLLLLLLQSRFSHVLLCATP